MYWTHVFWTTGILRESFKMNEAPSWKPGSLTLKPNKGNPKITEKKKKKNQSPQLNIITLLWPLKSQLANEKLTVVLKTHCSLGKQDSHTIIGTIQ